MAFGEALEDGQRRQVVVVEETGDDALSEALRWLRMSGIKRKDNRFACKLWTVVAGVLVILDHLVSEDGSAEAIGVAIDIMGTAAKRREKLFVGATGG